MPKTNSEEFSFSEEQILILLLSHFVKQTLMKTHGMLRIPPREAQARQTLTLAIT